MALDSQYHQLRLSHTAMLDQGALREVRLQIVCNDIDRNNLIVY